MIQSIARGSLCFAFALALAGCVTSSPLGTAHVTILSDGRASVDGSKVEIAKLGRKLKSLGATPDTKIIVGVPSNTPKATLTGISRTLAVEGFTHVAFRTPVEATAAVSDGASKQPATPAPPIMPKSPKAQKPVRSETL